MDKIFKYVDYFCSLAEKLPPNSSSLKEVLHNLEKLETYSGRKEYAEKNLNHLSSGSSRLVYSDGDIVIKLAKNDKGIAQNKAEANPKMKSKYINKILGHAPNYEWICTYFLNKIKEKEFEDMTKISFKNFEESIRYGLKSISGNSDKEKPDCFDKISKSDIYKELVRIGKEFKLLPGDIVRISSWGEKDNHPVLIDAGLTRQVYDKFYDYSS